MDGVVPLAVEGMRFEVDPRQVFVGDAPAFGVGTLIDSALDQETRFGGGGADQIHYDLMAQQRLAAPVLGDERE